MNHLLLHKFLAHFDKTDKVNFILSLPHRAKVLDVGCGNASPLYVKTLRPDLFYIGIDVADFNQIAPHDYADVYEIVAPEDFHRAIQRYAQAVDAVISSHNLEHCHQPREVLLAMMAALKPGGQLYLSFPCEESLTFPHRRGTLNFHDDRTHQRVPNWSETLALVQASSMEVSLALKRVRPLPLLLLGLLLEPLSMIFRRKLPGTWQLYGFESRITATRKHLPGEEGDQQANRTGALAMKA